MSALARHVQDVVLRSLSLLTIGVLAACSDGPPAPGAVDTSGLGSEEHDVIVSSPTPLASLPLTQRLTLARLARSAAGAPAPDEISYVSLPAGTVPEGSMARIKRTSGSDSPVFTSVRDGGFNPVPIAVFATDTVDVRITSASGSVLYTNRLPVRPTRPPAIVRSYPPKRKTDIAINGSIVIVFSEPLSESSLSGSAIQVFRGSTLVPSSIQTLPGTGALVAVTPDGQLASNTDYRVVIQRTVSNTHGQSLPNEVTLTYRTGRATIGPVATVTVSPDTAHLVDSPYQMAALVQDTAGNVLVDEPVTWSADGEGIRVSSTGVVTPRAGGTWAVVATAGGVQGVAIVVVDRPTLPASITLTPSSVELPPGNSVVLQATVRDSLGIELQRTPDISWSSSDSSVARLNPDATSVVIAVAPGTAVITARSGDASGTATITVAPREIIPITASAVFAAGHTATCALDVAQSAYCWGQALGDGTFFTSAVPVRVPGGLAFTRIASGERQTCGLATGGETYCWGNDHLVPTLLAPGLSFVALTVGGFGGNQEACGLTASGNAYCWGRNSYGMLGDGTSIERRDPVPVGGGLQFKDIGVGENHTCGLTTAGATYCWGTVDFDGVSGRYSDSLPQFVPGPAFVSITAGGNHTCALTASGEAYCWGDNGQDFPSTSGFLGDGTTNNHITPVAVAGSHTFTQLSSGLNSTCAIDDTGVAYCWGVNYAGQLGNGTIGGRSLVPAPVATDLRFKRVSVGSGFACGLAVSDVLYCWGDNMFGQLGDGTTTRRAVPTKVVGQP